MSPSAAISPTRKASAAFTFAVRPQIVFGPGTLRQLGDLVGEHGGTRALVVTDPGIVAAGHADRAMAVLRSAGLVAEVFDGVIENPTTRVVDQCASAARVAHVDLLVGLGGGSSLDTAKGCNFLLTGGGHMEDYWSAGRAAQQGDEGDWHRLPRSVPQGASHQRCLSPLSGMLPMIAVPTTAGTGSECQSYAIISQERTHVKMACGDPQAAPRVALLDPELTLTQPRSVTVAAGIDAVAHAVESAVTRRRTPLSRMLSREAFARLARALPRVLQEPGDLDARGEVLLGASLAGMAIENSMLGAAHAAANPLTARYGLAHGLAVGTILPHVVQMNAEDPAIAAIYTDLASGAGLVAPGAGVAAAVCALIDLLEGFLSQARGAASIKDIAADAASLDTLARQAAAQWTGRFNPRPVGPEDFTRLYRAALLDGRA